MPSPAARWMRQGGELTGEVRKRVTRPCASNVASIVQTGSGCDSGSPPPHTALSAAASVLRAALVIFCFVTLVLCLLFLRARAEWVPSGRRCGRGWQGGDSRHWRLNRHLSPSDAHARPHRPADVADSTSGCTFLPGGRSGARPQHLHDDSPRSQGRRQRGGFLLAFRLIGIFALFLRRDTFTPRDCRRFAGGARGGSYAEPVYVLSRSERGAYEGGLGKALEEVAGLRYG